MDNSKPNIRFMMRYVEKYLDGKTKRFGFELDFKYHLLRRWDGMCEEDLSHAKAFKYYMADNGFEAGEDLSGRKYKELIKKQYESLIEKGFK
ncbi:MAG: hypothetical protein FWG91_02320 [Lachnospiraceae bacterium]|nr:hypothetical protein [Lachnospiraceae bacterium]